MGSKLKAAEPIAVKLVGPEQETEFEGAPLFESTIDDKKITHVLVQRTDPDEGVVGRMPPTLSEMDLKRRWGGGTFMLQGRDDRNHSIKGAHRSITVGGDPIFESKSAEAKWKRAQGLDGTQAAERSNDAIGIKELFALLTSTDAKQKAETERRMEESEAAHRREMDRIKLEGELRARERAEEDTRRERLEAEREERRLQAAEEREERRRKEEADREERRRKDDEAARGRDREFQLLIKKGGGDASDMLLKGIALARELAGGGGGDGESDPVSTVAAALLPGLKDILSGNGRATPAAPRGEQVVFEGEIAGKMKRAVAHLQGEGFDPEAAIGSVLDTVVKMKRQTAPPQPPRSPPPPPLAPPPARRPARAAARAPARRAT